MKRLFIGLDFGEQVNESVSRALRKLRSTFDQREIEARWQKSQDLHITLVFIGERSEENVDNIMKIVENVANEHEQFELKLSGMGAFPDLQSARVVWMGVQKCQPLLDIQSTLESKLQILQSTEYTPHVTVARLRNLKSIRSLVSPFLRQKWGLFKVEHVIVYESVQNGPYSSYKQLAKFKLRPL